MKNSTDKNEITHNNMPEAIASIAAEVNEIKKTLVGIQLEFEPKFPTEYLSRIEVSKMLKCDLSTLHNWTEKGLLIKHGIGNRIYYKRSELEAAIVKI